MQEKKLKSSAEYILFLIFMRFLKLFSYRHKKKIIINLFLFFGMVVGVRKRVVFNQLKEIFPGKTEDEIDNLAWQVYENLAITSLEMFFGKNISSIESEGRENIKNALKLRRGVILVSGHIGNWELAGRYLAQHKLPINVVIKRLRNSKFNDYVNRTREQAGIKILYKSKTIRAILQALRNNEIVVMLIDQDAGKDGIRLPFLGKKASVITGFARLAQRYNTPLIWSVALKDLENKNYFIFEKHVLPSEFGEGDDGIVEIVKYFNSRLEKYILKYPEQWFWVHRRWKGAEKAKSPDSR